MKKPFISVIMPAYNHERFVGKAIESVLSQSFEDFEFIIINDGSTDETERVISGYIDPRITYIYQENKGCADTLNKALSLSKGEYISIINSDDIYHKERLKVLFDTAKDNDLSFLITDIELIDRDGEVINDPAHWWIKWYEDLKLVYSASDSPLLALLAGNYTISTSNFFFKANLIKEIGGFRPFRYILDYDFAYRAIKHKRESFEFLKEMKLLFYRLHGENTILSNPLLANHETFIFLKRALKELFGQKIHIPIEHLHKVIRYMIKELNIKRKNVISNVKRLENELQGKNSEISRLENELQGKNSEIQSLLDYSKHLLNEFYFIKGSYTYRITKTLLHPVAILRGLIYPSKKKDYIRLSVKNMHELKMVLENIDKEFDVVSFDIFDTIFERDIDPPDKVKEVVARNVSTFIKQNYNLDFSMFDLLHLRNDIELRLRQKALSEGKDFECCYNEIVKELVIGILGRDDEVLFQKIIEQEIRVENEVLYLKDGVMDVLNSLRNKGKKIIAISDMYLDKEYIQKIFELKSISNLFDKIYVSSEQAICKYSGNLFKHVLLNERLLPAQLLHIGDNRVSDHEIPKKLGINTIYLNDKEYQRTKYILKTYNKLSAHNPYWRGKHLLHLIRPILKERDFFYRYGFSFLGPVYSTFVYGVSELIKKYKIRKVYFIAREGELFYYLFKLFSSDFFKDDMPEIRYVYLTRKSTALASAHKGLSHEKAIIPLYNPKQQGLFSIFNTFGLPMDELTGLAEEHGFRNIKEPIIDWHDKRFKCLLEDRRFQDIVVKCALSDKRLLEKYLSQEGFFEDKQIAFVDIGWNVTIQKFIQDAFIDRIDFPHVYGLYLGFRDGIKHDLNKNKNTIIGVLYDERLKNPSERIISRFEEIFEEGARAFHPTVVGYREDIRSGLIEPVFKDDSSYDRRVELANHEKLVKLRNGVIDFSSEFQRAIHLTGYTFEDIKPFILTLIERCIAFPNSEETDHLLTLTHSEDFGYENIMDFSNYRMKSFKLLLNPFKLLKLIRSSHWSYGSARSSNIPLINLLLRIYDIIWEPNF